MTARREARKAEIVQACQEAPRTRGELSEILSASTTYSYALVAELVAAQVLVGDGGKPERYTPTGETPDDGSAVALQAKVQDLRTQLEQERQAHEATRQEHERVVQLGITRTSTLLDQLQHIDGTCYAVADIPDVVARLVTERGAVTPDFTRAALARVARAMDVELCDDADEIAERMVEAASQASEAVAQMRLQLDTATAERDQLRRVLRRLHTEAQAEVEGSRRRLEEARHAVRVHEHGHTAALGAWAMVDNAVRGAGLAGESAEGRDV